MKVNSIHTVNILTPCCDFYLSQNMGIILYSLLVCSVAQAKNMRHYPALFIKNVALCHLVQCDLLQLAEVSFIVKREMKWTRQMIHQISHVQTQTKVTEIHISVVFPIPMELTSMLTSLLMITQQFLRILLIMMSLVWPCHTG